MKYDFSHQQAGRLRQAARSASLVNSAPPAARSGAATGAWLRAEARRGAPLRSESPSAGPCALKAAGSSPAWGAARLDNEIHRLRSERLVLQGPPAVDGAKTAPFEIAALTIHASSARTGGPISRTRESSSAEPVLVPAEHDRQAGQRFRPRIRRDRAAPGGSRKI